MGKGSFGRVFQAQVLETGETVAIKRIEKEKFNVTEVQILMELRGHPNIVQLHGAFPSGDELHLVFEYMPDTLFRVIGHYNQEQGTNPRGMRMEAFYVKLYQFQLMRGLAFMHGRGIAHYDIKPLNILINGTSHSLKICDFGCAVRGVYGEQHKPYIMSRWYRAPEIILENLAFSTTADLWSAGCIFAELILGQPLFTGANSNDQLVQIIKVLGTPSGEQLCAMNPNLPRDYTFDPPLAPMAWERVLRGWAPLHACDLLASMLTFDPTARCTPLDSLLHPFFAQLRSADERARCRMLFDFREDELWWLLAAERQRMIPAWARRG